VSIKLPELTFHIKQGGKLRKAETAEPLYIVMVVTNVFKDPIYRDSLMFGQRHHKRDGTYA